MADELSITVRMNFRKGGAKVNRTENISVDITGDAFTHEVQEVGTTQEELAQGADLGTPGMVLAINLDATNYVEVGSTTGVYTIKILAGGFALWYHNSATVYAKANTAACLLEYIIVEV